MGELSLDNIDRILWEEHQRRGGYRRKEASEAFTSIPLWNKEPLSPRHVPALPDSADSTVPEQ